MITPSESNDPKNFCMNDETQEKLKAPILINKYKQLITSKLIWTSKVMKKAVDITS